ncbi:MAG: hypothetical protein EU531_03870 [Promethearchaeota archaeon]|nr:MAG: hypothetical protein EU531_03870 [Candidatus Lokiarchaeota archaeon]
MSKFKKNNSKSKKTIVKSKLDESFAYKTVFLTAILSGIFLIISFLFNSQLITIFMVENTIWFYIDIVIKVLVILLFFLFSIISIGNYKELSGKPLDYKLVFLLFILSLIQSYRNLWVFGFTFLGLLVIIAYFYFIQEN